MKKYFTKIIAVCLFSFICFTSLASSESSEESASSVETDDQLEQVKDCTFSIKGNYDGVEVDVEITVYDITWAECAALKVAVAALQ